MLKKNKKLINKNIKRKAISSIIVIIILIAIVTILIGMFATWATDNTKKRLDNINSKVKIKSKLECNNLKLEFNDLNINRVTKHISFLLNNNSNIDIKNLVISLQAKTYDNKDTKIVGVYQGRIPAGSYKKINTKDSNFVFTKQDHLLLDIDPYNIELLTITTPSCPENHYDLSDIDVYDPLYDNVILHWDFNKNDDLVLIDVSGNDNNGQIVNSTVEDFWSKGNNQGYFDGQNNNVQKSVDLMPNTTVHILFYVYDLDFTNPLFNWIDWLDGGFRFFIDSINRMRFQIGYNGGVDNYYTDDKIIKGWNLFSASFNDENLILCLNGKIKKINIQHIMAIVPQGIALGYGGGIGTAFFNGIVKDLRIYNKALDENELSVLYKETKQKYIPDLPVLDGLIGYWTLDQKDSNSTTIYDLSGQFNNAISNNNPVFVEDQKGDNNAAISFNGIDDYLDPNLHFNLDTGKAYTFNAWASFDRNDVSQVVFGSDSIRFFLNHYPVSSIWYSYLGRIWDGNSVNPVVYYVSADNSRFNTVGEWNFISYIMDRVNNKLYLYINGEFIDEEDIAPGYGVPSFNLYFGGKTNNWYWDGALSDITVYNRSLSESEIQQLYNHGLKEK
jgi:FlaG/FlaF family flagellin (archaellin)